MFNNRYYDRNNIAGLRVAGLRKGLRISQRELADRLHVIGMDVDKNVIQRIESGQRFITDISCKDIQHISRRFIKGGLMLWHRM